MYKMKLLVRICSIIVIISSFIFLVNQKIRSTYRVDYPCPPAGAIILTVVPGGRLGNLVWEYFSMFGIAHEFSDRVWAVPPIELINGLSRAFTGFKLPILEELHEQCDYPELNLTAVQKTHVPVPASELMKSIPKAVAGDILLLRKYEVFRATLKHIIPILRKQMKFKPELLAHAEAVLNRARLNVLAKLQIIGSTNVSSVDDLGDFVGVHVRRSDYIEYIKKRSNTTRPAGVQYFQAAIREMRGILRTISNRRPIFVVASDDEEWCRNELESTVEDLIVAGSGDISNPEFDLALLSSCNHSIFAYGTYGLTASVFAGGYTIMYAGKPNKHYFVFPPYHNLDF